MTFKGGRKWTAMWMGCFLGLVVMVAELAMGGSISPHAEMYLLYFASMVSVFAGTNTLVERGYAAAPKPKAS